MPKGLEPGESDRRNQENDGRAPRLEFAGLEALTETDHAYSDALVAELAAALEAKCAELRALDDDASSARAAVELDQTRVGRLSRMDALQGQAMAQEQQRRRRQEILRINAALKRITDGVYGWCLKCGDAIPEPRLKSNPAAPLCVDCAT